MQELGINTGLLLIQLVPVIVMSGLPVISLIDLAKKKLNGAPLALWVLVICAVPLVGPLACWIIKPASASSI